MFLSGHLFVYFCLLSICILTAEPVPYSFYVAFKLIMTHILPMIIVILTIIR